ncbi:MAG TPA: hypothetical protein PLD25_31210 [Chloroflexota bacterium]|nr:hypothetical protein [Chloroflexota bacterium]
MKRLFIFSLIFLILLVALAAVLNAPRVAEARAHEAAAHAMQTQAIVTGLAVAGMLLLVALLALALALVVGLFLWGVVTGRLAMIGTPSINSGQGFGTQPLKQRRMQIHHAPHPQLPAGQVQLPVPHYDTGWETELDWSVWENTPWDIEESF